MFQFENQNYSEFFDFRKIFFEGLNSFVLIFSQGDVRGFQDLNDILIEYQ